MSNELANTTASVPADGLDGYTDEVSGAETRKQGLIRGTLLRFSNTAEWETKDGEVLDQGTRLVLIEVIRTVVRWGKEKDKGPVETVVLDPGEKFPDVEEWNNALDKSEWLEGLNGLRGPWTIQQIARLVDPRTMVQFSFPTSTTGGAIAIRDVMDSIKAMRRFRPGATPIVELTSTFMKTKFGGRQRPHFIIRDWVGMPGNDPRPAALPAPTATAQSKSFALGDAVKPVTLQEELNDEIPTFESPKENNLKTKGVAAKQRAAKKAAQAST
jgi:hypothetical protein